MLFYRLFIAEIVMLLHQAVEQPRRHRPFAHRESESAADDDRQIQLNGFADFALLAWGDVGANCLAVRSTDLAVSSRPARIFICWRP